MSMAYESLRAGLAGSVDAASNLEAAYQGCIIDWQNAVRARDAALSDLSVEEARVLDLAAEVARLSKLVGPVWKVVRDFDFIMFSATAPLPSYYVDGAAQNLALRADGARFRVEPGVKRCEMGGKDPKLAMVIREPYNAAPRRYTMDFVILPGPPTSNKVNLWQFWAKTGEEPTYCAELWNSEIRIVQNIKEGPWTGRKVLRSIPIVRGVQYKHVVEAKWVGYNDPCGDGSGWVISIQAGGSPDITAWPSTYQGLPVMHKFGAYAPGYADPAVAGPPVEVLYKRVLVEEESAP